ncbi:hypothetical protein SAMN05216522_11750 [Rosenbergiella nectarea]|uniref:Uncharacterized protein n=1 Tax=Rosenbergiella nectarea TaxID=988801 RepID=A0A1H9MRG5_9GAMM|nr:hypothetical protein [Rosenbergiella nectarea]SER26191.1 hypothetical protein SAMN05216522_11750 [Rosenbergiella nectarea]
MKLKEMPIEVKVIAANLLANQIPVNVDLLGGRRIEESKKIADTIRNAFEELFTD